MSYFSSLVILLFISCNCYSQITLEQKEDKAMRAVEALPEVKKLINSWKDTSSHITLMIEEYPSLSFKYFWVKVGFSDQYIFTTIYHFLVQPQTYKVFYYSIVDDTILTLAQWRNQKKYK
jgi:hypothetical protein